MDNLLISFIKGLNKKENSNDIINEIAQINPEIVESISDLNSKLQKTFNQYFNSKYEKLVKEVFEKEKMNVHELLFYSNKGNIKDNAEQFKKCLMNNDQILIVVNIEKEYELGIFIDKRIEITNDFVERDIKYIDLKNKKVFKVKEGSYDEETKNSELSFYLADDTDYLFQIGVGDLTIMKDFRVSAMPVVYNSNIKIEKSKINSLSIIQLEEKVNCPNENDKSTKEIAQKDETEKKESEIKEKGNSANKKSVFSKSKFHSKNCFNHQFRGRNVRRQPPLQQNIIQPTNEAEPHDHIQGLFQTDANIEFGPLNQGMGDDLYQPPN